MVCSSSKQRKPSNDSSLLQCSAVSQPANSSYAVPNVITLAATVTFDGLDVCQLSDATKRLHDS
jgi:hypothetical protein